MTNRSTKTRLAALLLAAMFLLCAASAALAVTVSATVNGEEQPDVPEAVFAPGLVGTWGFHDVTMDTDIFWTFNADGTGEYDANGVVLPIQSVVMTDEPFGKKPEDGVRTTVYFGAYTVEYEGDVFTVQMGPMDYGFYLEGNSLRIVVDPDIPGSYTPLTRE